MAPTKRRRHQPRYVRVGPRSSIRGEVNRIPYRDMVEPEAAEGEQGNIETHTDDEVEEPAPARGLSKHFSVDKGALLAVQQKGGDDHDHGQQIVTAATTRPATQSKGLAKSSRMSFLRVHCERLKPNFSYAILDVTPRSTANDVVVRVLEKVNDAHTDPSAVRLVFQRRRRLVLPCRRRYSSPKLLEPDQSPMLLKIDRKRGRLELQLQEAAMGTQARPGRVADKNSADMEDPSKRHHDASSAPAVMAGETATMRSGAGNGSKESLNNLLGTGSMPGQMPTSASGTNLQALEQTGDGIESRINILINDGTSSASPRRLVRTHSDSALSETSSSYLGGLVNSHRVAKSLQSLNQLLDDSDLPTLTDTTLLTTGNSLTRTLPFGVHVFTTAPLGPVNAILMDKPTKTAGKHRAKRKTQKRKAIAAKPGSCQAAIIVWNDPRWVVLVPFRTAVVRLQDRVLTRPVRLQSATCRISFGIATQFELSIPESFLQGVASDLSKAGISPDATLPDGLSVDSSPSAERLRVAPPSHMIRSSSANTSPGPDDAVRAFRRSNQSRSFDDLVQSSTGPQQHHHQQHPHQQPTNRSSTAIYHDTTVLLEDSASLSRRRSDETLTREERNSLKRLKLPPEPLTTLESWDKWAEDVVAWLKARRSRLLEDSDRSLPAAEYGEEQDHVLHVPTTASRQADGGGTAAIEQREAATADDDAEDDTGDYDNLDEADISNKHLMVRDFDAELWSLKSEDLASNKSVSESSPSARQSHQLRENETLDSETHARSLEGAAPVVEAAAARVESTSVLDERDTVADKHGDDDEFKVFPNDLEVEDLEKAETWRSLHRGMLLQYMDIDMAKYMTPPEGRRIELRPVVRRWHRALIALMALEKARGIDLLRRFDTDDDGFLGRAEVYAVSRVFGLGIDAYECNALFDFLDTNRDGRIDALEFCRYLKVAHISTQRFVHRELSSPAGKAGRPAGAVQGHRQASTPIKGMDGSFEAGASAGDGTSEHQAGNLGSSSPNAKMPTARPSKGDSVTVSRTRTTTLGPGRASFSSPSVARSRRSGNGFSSVRLSKPPPMYPSPEKLLGIMEEANHDRPLEPRRLAGQTSPKSQAADKKAGASSTAGESRNSAAVSTSLAPPAFPDHYHESSKADQPESTESRVSKLVQMFAESAAAAQNSIAHPVSQRSSVRLGPTVRERQQQVMRQLAHGGASPATSQPTSLAFTTDSSPGSGGNTRIPRPSHPVAGHERSRLAFHRDSGVYYFELDSFEGETNTDVSFRDVRGSETTGDGHGVIEDMASASDGARQADAEESDTERHTTSSQQGQGAARLAAPVKLSDKKDSGFLDHDVIANAKTRARNDIGGEDGAMTALESVTEEDRKLAAAKEQHSEAEAAAVVTSKPRSIAVEAASVTSSTI